MGRNARSACLAARVGPPPPGMGRRCLHTPCKFQLPKLGQHVAEIDTRTGLTSNQQTSPRTWSKSSCWPNYAQIWPHLAQTCANAGRSWPAFGARYRCLLGTPLQSGCGEPSHKRTPPASNVARAGGGSPARGRRPRRLRTGGGCGRHRTEHAAHANADSCAADVRSAGCVVGTLRSGGR